MYQNVGLKTPRGSGTSGHVQKNVSFLKPKPKTLNHNTNLEKPKAVPKRKPSNEVLLHKAKRAIELECLEYRAALLESSPNLPEEDLEAKVQRQRELLLAELVRRNGDDDGQKGMKMEKELELERMRTAFGIEADAKEGRAFRFGDEEERKRISKQKFEEQQRELFYSSKLE